MEVGNGITEGLKMLKQPFQFNVGAAFLSSLWQLRILLR